MAIAHDDSSSDSDFDGFYTCNLLDRDANERNIADFGSDIRVSPVVTRELGDFECESDEETGDRRED